MKQLKEGSPLSAGIKMENSTPLQRKSSLSSAKHMSDLIEDDADTQFPMKMRIIVLIEDEDIEYEDYDDDDEYDVGDDDREKKRMRNKIVQSSPLLHQHFSSWIWYARHQF